MKINILPFLSLVDKNAFLTIDNRLGYEWWWHSFVAKNEKTNELKPFFIEYYTINPTLSNKKIVKQIPSYFMLKTGTWGNDTKEINDYYDMDQIILDTKKMNIVHKNNYFFANETYIKGYVNHKNFLNINSTDLNKPAYLEWDLKINKTLSYDLGYSTSSILRFANFAQMYWHIKGMRSYYEGIIKYNNEIYNVIPELSYGYQDKNWGTFLTPKWIWLNCNNFIDINGNKIDSSIVVGGSIPVIFNIKIFETLIIIFYHKNKKYEFNFTKFWNKLNEKINIYKDDKYIYFKIIANTTQVTKPYNLFKKNKLTKISLEIDFKCEIKKMLFINYQDISGNIPHKELYNGHHAFGQITIIENDNKEIIKGEFGGCEFGLEKN
jgi:tocopherol cyclase